MAEVGDRPRIELSSWKEIADYLGVSVRTAQEWEKDKGLPVRRLSGPKGRLAADKGELDNWRRRALAPSRNGRTRRNMIIATGALGLAPAGFVASRFLRRRGRVEAEPAPRATGNRSTLESAPTARVGPIAQVVDGRIYVGFGAGGPNGDNNGDFDMYDPGRNSWHPLESPSEAYGCASAAMGDRIYVIGGVEHGGPLKRLDIYDPLRKSWSRGPDMRIPRCGAASAVWWGNAYVFGGYTFFNDVVGTRECEAFVARRSEWRSLAPMPRPRMFAAAAVVDGRIYAFGGRDGDTILDEVLVYEPSSNRWTLLAERMPRPRCSMAAVMVDNSVLLLGGNAKGPEIFSAVDRFHPATRQWSRFPPMLTERAAPAAVFLNGIIYVFGGENTVGKLSTVEAFDTQPGGPGVWSTRVPNL